MKRREDVEKKEFPQKKKSFFQKQNEQRVRQTTPFTRAKRIQKTKRIGEIGCTGKTYGRQIDQVEGKNEDAKGHRYVDSRNLKKTRQNVFQLHTHKHSNENRRMGFF